MTEYRGDGLRAQRIQDQRERELEDLEIRKKKLTDNLEMKDIANKFSATYDSVAGEISAATVSVIVYLAQAGDYVSQHCSCRNTHASFPQVGLVTIDEMKRTQERVMQEREQKLIRMEEEKKNEAKAKLKAKAEKKAKEKKKLKTLSFNPDEDEEEDEDEDVDKGSGKKELKEVIRDMKEKRKSEEVLFEAKKKRFGMNPDVETKFLPDRDRDAEENFLREKLRLEWERRQKEIKEEEVDIIYSYWDGSGHKKSISMKKGNSIYMFLCKVLDAIRNEFPELKTASGDQLMYVKEDLIIPQTNTFYDFIVSHARGKSGPLFNFDLKEEEVAEEGLHTGKVLFICIFVQLQLIFKVILRAWYERNKHIFPASRWEPYDPTKVVPLSALQYPDDITQVYSTHIPPNPFNDFRVVDPMEPEGGSNILAKLGNC